MEGWSDSCLICGERFFSVDSMQNHIENEHCSGSRSSKCVSRINSHCPLCQFESASPSDVQTHIASIHAEDIAMSKTTGKQYDVASSSSRNELLAEDGKSAGCPVCDLNNFASWEALNSHINGHFSEKITEELPHNDTYRDQLLALRLQQHENFQRHKENEKVVEEFNFQDLKEQYGMGESDQNIRYQDRVFKNMGRSVGKTLSPMDYYNAKIDILEKLEQGIDDGMTTDSAVFGELRDHLERTLYKNHVAYLSSHLDFIGRGYGDAGWGCGYRNIQMLISCLNKHEEYSRFVRHRFNGDIPSIPKIQESIETAWKDGYDVKGSEQLQSKVLNTTKWIGATEAFSYFAHMKLHCRIVDFIESSTAQPSHHLLHQWLMEYFGAFDTARNVVVTAKPPLYFQHDGHSRTIAGIVCSKSASATNVVRLVIFDPGVPSWNIRKKEKRNGSTFRGSAFTLCTKQFLKPVSNLSKRQYQIVSIVGMASERRTQQQKDVDAVCEKVQ